MTKKTATITAVLWVVALAALALPAAAQEPDTWAPRQAGCLEHDETSMPHAEMEGWMGEMGLEMTAGDHAEMHAHMHEMMATMHADTDAHHLDEGSMSGPRSMMGAGPMMGSGS